MELHARLALPNGSGFSARGAQGREHQDDDAPHDRTGWECPNGWTHRGPRDGHDERRQLTKELEGRHAEKLDVAITPMNGDGIETVQEDGQADDGNQKPQNGLPVEPRVRNPQQAGGHPQADAAQDLHGPRCIEERRFIPAGVADDGRPGTDCREIGQPLEKDVRQAVEPVGLAIQQPRQHVDADQAQHSAPPNPAIVMAEPRTKRTRSPCGGGGAVSAATTIDSLPARIGVVGPSASPGTRRSEAAGPKGVVMAR